jgi:CHAD domain-containing protein
MAASGKWIDGIGPETTVADAARRSLETRLAVVAHTLPLAAHLASHDIEHVHRLRVATRRAGAALKLYRDWLPQKSARWFKKRLRQIRHAAGEARDLDVLVQRLQRESSAQVEPVVFFLAEKRAAVQPSIVELADDMRRDDRFVYKASQLFDKLADSDGGDQGASPESLREWAPEQLAKFRSAFVERLPDGSEDVEKLHQFRICAKALRYAIELLAPAFETELRSEIYPAVEKLQEELGTITDHIAARRLFAEWEEHNAAHTPSGGESYLDREKALELEDLQRFRNWWTSERADRFVESLANPIGVGSPIA